MIDYEKKYKDYTEGWFQCIPDVSQEYPDCNGFEKCVIAFRKEGGTYGQIQTKLGMPPKKQIREVLLKGAPELIDNSKVKTIKISTSESELYNIIKNHNNETFDIWGDLGMFFIKDNKLVYKDDLGVWEFSDGDSVSQSQILEQIKEQLNGR